MLPIILASVLFFEALVIIGVKQTRDKEYLTHLQRRVSAHPFEKALSIYIFLITSLYTFIVSAVLSPFRCYPQADGSYTLIPNPSQNCFEETWKSHLPLIGFGILQIVLIPLLLMMILYKYKTNRTNSVYEWRYGLLTRPFKDEFCYWEFVLLVKKTVIVTLVDATNGYSAHTRVFITLSFLIAVFALETIFRPYKAHGLASLAATRYVSPSLQISTEISLVGTFLLCSW
jgi:hypothetical protein